MKMMNPVTKALLSLRKVPPGIIEQELHQGKGKGNEQKHKVEESPVNSFV